jgi:integrase
LTRCGEQRAQQVAERESAGPRWQEHGLVFASMTGTPLDSSHVRRIPYRHQGRPGIDPSAWTPRDLRHSFVSLLSDNGIPLEEISRLVGHSSTAVTDFQSLKVGMGVT